MTQPALRVQARERDALDGWADLQQEIPPEKDSPSQVVSLAWKDVDVSISQRSRSKAPVYLSADQIAQMLRDYADTSISLKDIEARYEVSSARVYAELEKAGLPRRVRVASFKDHLDPNTVAGIVAAYSAHVQVDQIAANFSLNYDQVYVVIREQRLPPRSSDRRTGANPDFQRRLAELYADDTLSITEVASRLNVSVKTLTRMVSRFDLPKRGKGGGKRGISNAVIQRLDSYAVRAAAGETVAALAAEAGIGESTLREKIRQFRLKP